MRHQHQLAPHADPDVAGAIGERGMEQRDVRPDRRHQQDRSRWPKGLSITRQSGRWRTRSEPSTPRSGRNGTPFSAACRPAWIAGQVEVAQRDRAGPDRGDEARRRPVLAERDRRRLDAAHAAGADQEVGLEAQLRHADQVAGPARRGGSARAPPRARSRNSRAPAPGWRRPRCARRGSRRRLLRRAQQQDLRAAYLNSPFLTSAPPPARVSRSQHLGQPNRPQIRCCSSVTGCFGWQASRLQAGSI